MMTAEQLMKGAQKLAVAARVREEHAKSARVPFDRAMYAKAADQLHGWSMDLERWSRIALAYEGQPPSAEVQAFSESAIRMLDQLRHINAGAET